jgi:molybdopterin converting factor small subunit
MSVKIQIPSEFLGYTHNLENVEVDGNTVGECFAALTCQCPEIKKAVYNSDGSLSSYIPIFKNEDFSFEVSESSPVKDGDVLIIMFSGG